jgi:uncharacterized Fe-S cluster-containing MiaB family protein
LVTTVKVSTGGFEMTGKCLTCGYSYDSEYTLSEVSEEDLPAEFSRQLEAAAPD